ncbi:MAG: GNAT family N-acetyltransferase, partial [Pseudomonadota bacterium]
MSLLFRLAVREDVPVLVAMLADDMLGAQREVVSDPPAPAYFAAFDAVAQNPHENLVVAEREGEIVGCGQLTVLHGLSRQGMARGQIEAVRVASTARGGGIGEALVSDLIDRARVAGCGLVQLTSDARRDRAHAF